MSSRPIDIFDSNVWLLALTRQNTTTERLVTAAVSGSRTVGVSPYIAQEVHQALQASSNDDWQRLATGFFTQIQQSDTIHAPSQAGIGRVNLESVRSRREIRLLAELLNVETRDAPIVAYAKEHADRTPTIYTNDHSFSRLTPSTHDIEWLSLEHVS